MTSPKEQIAELQKTLRNMGPEMDPMRKFLQLKYEDAKEKLVEAMAADTERFQGEARTYKRLLIDVSWAPKKDGGPA